MVVATMPWLTGSLKGASNHTLHFFFQDKTPPPTLRILAFDTAKTMAALISLYRSLTDKEISKLRNHVIPSKGVVYLNSMDEEFLLNLACSERLEELNNAASSVSRLSRKCADLGLTRFDLVFSDMKLGIFNWGKSDSGFKNVAKLIGKMEKLVFATAELHSAMEVLVEMEASEKKMQKRKEITPKQGVPLKFDMFDKKLASQRKDVKHFKEISLWNQSFDYAVGLMTRLVCVIYARIFAVFRPFVSDQVCSLDQNPQIQNLSNRVWRWNFHGEHRKVGGGDDEHKLVTQSGPIPKNGKKELIRFPSGIREKNNPRIEYGEFDSSMATNNRVYTSAPPTTVGGSGLSLNYANVILFAERCLNEATTIGDDARGELYQMLPARIKEKVRAKLRRNNWGKRGGGKEEMRSADDGHSLAVGWREAMEEMMGWLGPLAHDTVRWQSERNMEKQRFDTGSTVLLMQTLHYSDLEKTEAAIVEVLVGLCCIYRYENRRPQDHRSCDPL
ncbi:uncharacterized protein LOC111438146 [Cucurbita moschata]|uniref:Uncharacterized protein LOC111438146 n=1 Tax=Cucurbita moschata TaxID=3662 RepID=A0A6J1EVF1_CUCMO|nr:uncharacterized protein LOC111438146 [Cucurbita moschata]